MQEKVGDIIFDIPECSDPTNARNYGLPKEEQYWRREGLPQDWDEYDPKQRLDFIIEDLRRRVEGFWFWNNGILTYITGDHYMYLEWWYGGADTPDGYFAYWESDRKEFYFWEYCKKDPDCYGYMFVGPRRDGKSEKGLSKGYNDVTLGRERNFYIQHINEAEAKNLYVDRVLRSWREIPAAIRPKDEGLKEPKERLRFVAKTGSKSAITEKSLGSKIEYLPAKVSAVQGKKVHVLHADESATWERVNLLLWWATTKKTLTLGRKIIGKALLPVTVENMTPLGGQKYHTLWLQSNFNNRDKNGRTSSGLYTLFRPAYENLEGFIDKYGFCDQVAAKKFLENEREGADAQQLIILKRQYPFTIEEAFGAVQSQLWEEDIMALFNEVKKNIVHNNFMGQKKMVTEISGETRLVDTLSNDYIEVFEEPVAGVNYYAGFDGAGSDDETGNTDGSKVSFTIIKGFAGFSTTNYCEVAVYEFRPKKMEDAYYIFFLACKHWNKFGKLKCLGETNAGQGAAVKSYFANRGGLDMMQKAPKNPGFNKDVHQDKYWIFRNVDVANVQMSLAHLYLRRYGMNIKSIRLINSLIEFGKSNQDIASGWLMAVLLLGDITAEAPQREEPVYKRKVRRMVNKGGYNAFEWVEVDRTVVVRN